MSEQPDKGEMFEPSDVPALRRDLIEWLTDGRGYAFHRRQSRSAGSMLGRPELDGHPIAMHAYAELLCQQEPKALKEAELYYVTAEMTSIVQAAAASMPAFVPRADDFPTPCGLVLFEAPLVTYRRSEEPIGLMVENRLALDFRDQPYEDIAIVACSWGPYNAGGGWRDGGVFMSFYRDRRHLLSRLRDDSVRDDIRSTLARLVPDNECGMAFDDSPELQEAVQAYDQPAFTTHWAKYLMATLLLMNQPLVYQRDEAVRRGLRRQLERAGYPTGGIRILDVRPRRYATAPTAEDLEGTAGDDARRGVSVRFPVAGHWRNHWYPKREVHRPMWIEEHWRGPEDAPIVHPERVRVLRNHEERQPS